MRISCVLFVILLAFTAKAQDASSDVWSKRMGGSTLKLIDISLDALLAGGWSTQGDGPLQTLQGGGHDPRKRGFTIQNVELSLIGAVDPYFRGEAHLIYFLDPLSGESSFELEEAFVTTLSVPYGFQVKAGQFFTEFGRFNPTHPHAWNWLDQPVVNTRIFGPDGMRGPGLRVSWLIPVHWFSDISGSMQNANGETMASFFANDEYYEERPIGHRPFTDPDVSSPADFVYLARWANGFDLADSLSSKLGISALFGPNASGSSGRTEMYGTDVVLKWRPDRASRGWPFLSFEGEWMHRLFHADRAVDDTDPSDVIVYPKDTLHDWGGYAQLLWGFTPRWAGGLRYEFVGGQAESFGGRASDPFRSDRHRASPILAWYPSEFSRLRLQYNYDRADHLPEGSAHSVWLGMEFLYGSHPAHSF